MYLSWKSEQEKDSSSLCLGAKIQHSMPIHATLARTTKCRGSARSFIHILPLCSEAQGLLQPVVRIHARALIERLQSRQKGV